MHLLLSATCCQLAVAFEIDLRTIPPILTNPSPSEENTMASNHYEGQASTNYKEAFSLFDTRGVGRVVLDKLGDLLRACGQNPTLAEIRDLEKSVGGECEYSLVRLAGALSSGLVLRPATDGSSK